MRSLACSGRDSVDSQLDQPPSWQTGQIFYRPHITIYGEEILEAGCGDPFETRELAERVIGAWLRFLDEDERRDAVTCVSMWHVDAIDEAGRISGAHKIG